MSRSSILFALLIALFALPAFASDEGSGQTAETGETKDTSSSATPTQDLFNGLLDHTPQGWVSQILAPEKTSEAREAAAGVDRMATDAEQ